MKKELSSIKTIKNKNNGSLPLTNDINAAMVIHTITEGPAIFLATNPIIAKIPIPKLVAIPTFGNCIRLWLLVAGRGCWFGSEIVFR